MGGGTYNLIASIVAKPPKAINANNSITIDKKYYNKVGTAYNPIDPTSIMVGGNWSNIANILTTRSMPAGCGTASAALLFGGYNKPSKSYKPMTELFNGSVWSNTSETNNCKDMSYGHGSCGIYNNALAFISGHPDKMYSASTELFNGSTWSIQSGKISYVNKMNLSGCGIANSALASGGYDGGWTYYRELEYYNGSTWSTLPTLLNTARLNNPSIGISNNALWFGGKTSNENCSITTESYNGTTSKRESNMNVARTTLAGSGLASDGLAFGGYASTSYLNTTELFNGLVWSIKSNMIKGREKLEGCGESTNTIAYAGVNGVNNANWIATTEQYKVSYYSPDLSTWPDSTNVGTLLSNVPLTVNIL